MLSACPEHTGQAPVERRDEPCWLVAGGELEDPRRASAFAEPGVPARTPAAAGKEGELAGVFGKRSHAKRHLAARET